MVKLDNSIEKLFSNKMNIDFADRPYKYTLSGILGEEERFRDIEFAD